MHCQRHATAAIMQNTAGFHRTSCLFGTEFVVMLLYVRNGWSQEASYPGRSDHIAHLCAFHTFFSNEGHREGLRKSTPWRQKGKLNHIKLYKQDLKINLRSRERG